MREHSISGLPIPRVYSVLEAAHLLGIHEKTVRTLMRGGHLGYVQAGHKTKIFITEAQLAAYLDAHTVDPSAY